MKAIIISPTEFMVNAIGDEAGLHMRGEIVLVDRIKTHSEGCYSGGSNENVPDYCFLDEEAWTEAAKNKPIIDLDSDPELRTKFWDASNALEEQFESEDDFVFNHINHFMDRHNMEKG
ncbi:MAG: hypothetical protein NTX66_02555 [Candidatus Falkowbacteria bacterium]|nr:hypothetical protein [Candidatus Falkowbacteria bacterium]